MTYLTRKLTMQSGIILQMELNCIASPSKESSYLIAILSSPLQSSNDRKFLTDISLAALHYLQIVFKITVISHICNVPLIIILLLDWKSKQ